MSDPIPAFADKWAFVFGRVLVAVDPASGQLFTLAGVDGRPLLAMWTDVETARAAVPSGVRVVQTDVLSRLAELPSGIGVVVDPDTDRGLVLDPEQAEALKPLTTPFPAGTRSELKQWPALPAELRRAITQVADRYAFVHRVWTLIYSIDDSPWIGLLVYRTDGGSEARESVTDALESALATTTSLEELAVPLVRIVAYDDLDPRVAATLDDQASIVGA